MNLISNAYVHVGFTTLNGCGDIWKHITLYACENLFSLSFSVVMNGISRCDFRHFIVASESKLKLSKVSKNWSKFRIDTEIHRNETLGFDKFKTFWNFQKKNQLLQNSIMRHLLFPLLNSIKTSWSRHWQLFLWMPSQSVFFSKINQIWKLKNQIWCVSCKATHALVVPDPCHFFHVFDDIEIILILYIACVSNQWQRGWNFKPFVL